MFASERPLDPRLKPREISKRRRGGAGGRSKVDRTRTVATSAISPDERWFPFWGCQPRLTRPPPFRRICPQSGRGRPRAPSSINEARYAKREGLRDAEVARLLGNAMSQ